MYKLLVQEVKRQEELTALLKFTEQQSQRNNKENTSTSKPKEVKEGKSSSSSTPSSLSHKTPNTQHTPHRPAPLVRCNYCGFLGHSESICRNKLGSKEPGAERAPVSRSECKVRYENKFGAGTWPFPQEKPPVRSITPQTSDQPQTQRGERPLKQKLQGPNPCYFCSGPHRIYECEAFAELKKRETQSKEDKTPQAQKPPGKKASP